MKWLHWILDNVWAVVIVGTVLVQMMKAIAGKKRGTAEMSDEDRPAAGFDDPELAERTRKIREEIQRKIEQRTRARAQDEASASVPPPLIRAPAVAGRAPASASRLDAQRQAEILEEQAALMERLQEAKQMKVAGQKRAEFEAATVDQAVAKRTIARAALLGDLRHPEALRRAFVLREVIGPPVALKR